MLLTTKACLTIRHPYAKHQTCTRHPLRLELNCPQQSSLSSCTWLEGSTVLQCSGQEPRKCGPSMDGCQAGSVIMCRVSVAVCQGMCTIMCASVCQR